MKPSVLMNIDTGEKTWLTPRHIIDALGPFDVDPCCPDGGMPWRTAARMITKTENGLAHEWQGHVWLNPPYGREAEPFFRRMAVHPGGGIALVFVRPDTALWQRDIFPCASSILFLRGRLRFCRQDGQPGDAATAPSALVGYGDWAGQRLSTALSAELLQGFFVALKDAQKGLCSIGLFEGRSKQ